MIIRQCRKLFNKHDANLYFLIKETWYCMGTFAQVPENNNFYCLAFREEKGKCGTVIYSHHGWHVIALLPHSKKVLGPNPLPGQSLFLCEVFVLYFLFRVLCTRAWRTTPLAETNLLWCQSPTTEWTFSTGR